MPLSRCSNTGRRLFSAETCPTTLVTRFGVLAESDSTADSIDTRLSTLQITQQVNRAPLCEHRTFSPGYIQEAGGPPP
jgi:hypothetical protein